MSMLSMAVMSGCGMTSQITDKLSGITSGNIAETTPEPEQTEEYLDFGEDETGTEPAETVSEPTDSTLSYSDYDDTGVNVSEGSDTGVIGFNNETTSETGTNTPMYSAEYYFSKISNMDLPEGATADEHGNIHYNGFRLVKQERDMLPATAVVGAEINYEVYVTALPDDEKNMNGANMYDDEDVYDNRNQVSSSDGSMTDNINRVQAAVAEAARIKESEEDGTYGAISREAATTIGRDTSSQEEKTKFVPTNPDEDPEYEGKLVSVKRSEIQGPAVNTEGPSANSDR